MKNLLIIVLCFGFSAAGLNAQTTSNAVLSTSSLSSETMIDQSVFMDAEEKICYVDLEKVPMNLKQAAIINNHGDEVVVMSLHDEPVDKIIELDYSDLPQGTYMLELQSYTGKTLMAIQL
ncbi:MAG: hypothetical protein DRI69_10435 [Bacteroidetes bacterium]|nr:MAG: hypothetical protein DRI69_10435 [Bacteroidota bacterium]